MSIIPIISTQIASLLRIFAKLLIFLLIPIYVRSEVRFSVFFLESGSPTNVRNAMPGSIIEIWTQATLTSDEDISGIVYRFSVSNDPGWLLINREFGVFDCKGGGESRWALEDPEDREDPEGFNFSQPKNSELPVILESDSDQINAASSFTPEIDFYFDSQVESPSCIPVNEFILEKVTLQVPSSLCPGSYTLEFNDIRAFDFLNSHRIKSVSIANSLQVNILNVANVGPSILNQSFDIDENSGDNTLIGIVDASDANDCDILTYSITSGNDNNAFGIDPNTGEIRVDNSAQLDFETNPNFILTVKVEDFGGLFSEANIQINLRDAFELTIEIGWNLISVPVTPDANLAGLLSALKINTLWQWNSQKFESVHELKPKQGYWIYGDRIETLSIFGSTLVNKMIPLDSGWNLIGPSAMPPFQGKSIAVTSILESAGNILANVWSWDGEKFKKAEFFTSGKGYWAYASGDADVEIHLP